MKPVLITLGLCLLAFLSFANGTLYVHFGNVSAEYRTIGLMNEIGEFIEVNARWPRGWDEVGLTPFAGVQVEWNVPLIDLDEWKIHKAINVKTKKWNVHPYYGNQVEALANIVRKARDRTTPETPVGK